MPNLPFGRRRARLPLDPAALAANLSFVLHERSDSAAVARSAAACQRHAERLAARRLPDTPRAVDGDMPDSVDLWLTASLGAPEALPRALRAVGLTVGGVLRVDVDNPEANDDPAPFFRAPARLALPGGELLVAVGGLVLRPDERTTQLVVRGAFAWPAQRDAALRALEQLIQPYADQWMPPRALWDGPAEVLLSGEIL